MKNEWEKINEQIAKRRLQAEVELEEKTSEVYYHREDYCNNLSVTTKTEASTFNTMGLRCKLMTMGTSCKEEKLSPKDVERLCSKHCHECPEYTDYIEPVRTIIDEFDEDDKRLASGVLKTIHYDKYGNVQSIDLEPDSDMIELENATEDDIDCYYEHLMKEGFHYYDEEKLADFYKVRPSIDSYNKLVWAFKSTGLKAGDYLDYAIPANILKEEAQYG